MAVTRIPQGTKWGKLTFIRELPAKGKRRFVECRCECGAIVSRRIDALTNEKHKHCCRKCVGPLISKRRTRHGASQSLEFKSWCSMRRRCTIPSAHNYSYYGGRGIKVCDEWLKSFPAFLRDMGKRPSIAHTLDRINGDGNYEPGNCRWADQKMQSRNRKDRPTICLNDVTKTIAEWAEITGISDNAIYRRRVAGWPAELILNPAITKQQAKEHTQRIKRGA